MMSQYKPDTVTVTFTILAVLISIYFATFEQSFIAIFPAILLISGLVLSIWVQGRQEPVDGIFTSQSYRIILYTLLALAGLGVGSLIGQNLFAPKILTLTLLPYQAKLYGVLMAVAEETFFRGFITQYMLLKMHTPTFALLASGAIFSVYHLAVYGTSMNAIFYVLAAGIILSVIVYKTGRLSSCVLAHCINNLIVT